MKIEDAYWTKRVNYLLIRCECGTRTHHRADRWGVRCSCGVEENLQQIRERYVAEQQQEREYYLPKITVSTAITTKATDEFITTQFQLDATDVGGSFMDDIKALVGDGLARVTVSADFGIKDYGTGAGAMATVSLTCGQDQQTIERAARIAGDLARDIAQEQRARAETELQAIIDQRGSSSPRSYGGG